jgi:Flp pilus assembly pilin Flp
MISAEGFMRFSDFRAWIRDENGTASIEFSIVLGVLVAAFLAAGMVIGPAVHNYATRLKTITLEARAVLDELKAATPPATAP